MNPCEEYELLLSARLDGALSLKEEKLIFFAWVHFDIPPFRPS